MVDRSLVRVHGMRKLILDLLDLTRIESGNRKREHVPVDLRQVAQTALETAQPDAKARGITLNLSAPQPVQSEGRPRRSRDHAQQPRLQRRQVQPRRRTRGRGHSTADGEDVKIAVADTGIGMTPEEAGRLFQDFVRIKNEKTRNILGSGLGLSIVKKLAQLYGGNVTVTSTPGQGSVFTLLLKLDAPAAELPDKILL